MILDWAKVFFLTLAVEIPIVVLWFRRDEPSGTRRGVVAAWATTATHPIVWFVFPPMCASLGLGYVATVELAELFAWLAEAALFLVALRAPVSRAVLGSAAANAASLLATFALRELTGLL
jgi:hypothetical protein